jgi:hypothetical protein
MEIINLIVQLFTLPILAGIIILSRHVTRTWQLVIGIILVILGLVLGIK